MLSGPPAAAARAWNADASVRAPWPACQALHSPWVALSRSVTAALPRLWAAALAAVVDGAWSATSRAWPGSSPVAATATPPMDRTATRAAAAALIVNSLLGTVALRGTRVGGRDGVTAL